MAKVRCKETTMDSFYGKFLYEQVIAKDHFLVKLKEVIDWSSYTKKFITYYKGKGEVGQAPYDPTMILKMLLVSYLYNISERQTEVVVNENLPTKFFVGLGVNEKSPDHATLTLFKNRLIGNCGIKIYEELFNEIIIVALEKGVKFGKIQVIDSVHTIANVNVIKEEQRKRNGKAARDAEAQWATKGNKIVISKDGKKYKEQEYYYGYKDQVSLNAESGLITSVIPGRATDWDGHSLNKLVEKDMGKGIAPCTVAADRGYDDGENHYYLQEKGINSAIRLKKNRLGKKDAHKEGWFKLVKNPPYQEGLRERYKIERKFGEAKKWHGFARCRYTGFIRHAIQSYLTFMALNLKRLVKLLTGVGFKGEAMVYTTSG